MAITKRAYAKIPTGKSKDSDIVVVPRGGRRIRLPQVLQAKPRNPKPSPEEEKPDVKSPDGKSATPQKAYAKIPAGKEAGAIITTKDQRGRQASAPFTQSIPPIPEYGYWEIPLVSVTGFAADLFQNGPAGAKLQFTGDEYTYATFSSTHIALNGGTPVLASTLPAGFNVYIARHMWGNWIEPDDEGSLVGSTGLVWIKDGTTLIAAKFTSWNWFIPMYIVYTYPNPIPQVATLLGKVFEAKQTLVYPGFYTCYAYGQSNLPQPRLYGYYQVL